jgi:hypothetical protein
MTGVRSDLVFVIGLMIGFAVYGPAKRWVIGLRNALTDLLNRPERRRAHTMKLLFIFVTMHPVPWLIGVGVPFALYRILVDPLRTTWLWLSAGVAIAVAAMIWYDSRIGSRTRA